jgi:hypothetical protein
MRFFLTKNTFFSSYGISQPIQAERAAELTNRCTKPHPQRQHADYISPRALISLFATQGTIRIRLWIRSNRTKNSLAKAWLTPPGLSEFFKEWTFMKYQGNNAT